MASSPSLRTNWGNSELQTVADLLLRRSNAPSVRKKARIRTRSLNGTIRSHVVSDFAAMVNSRANHIKVDISDTPTHGTLASPPVHLTSAVSAMNFGILNQQLHKEEIHQENNVDVLGRGKLVENKHVYRQVFIIRSYEVGYDKSASIETITNLFQETSLNHVGMMDFVGDGMGTTHAMMRNRLIWIVTRMHIEMIRYPVWGDMVQIDSWVSSSGKNGMRRDFLVREYSTGSILGRATSNWAMMNQDTRRLSKMPDEVRAEILPSFLDRSVMDPNEKDAFKRIPLLDDSAPYKTTGLAPKLQDLDMNQHVNHVKYINWVLESLPQQLLVSCELMRVTLEYRRECGSFDNVESLAQLEEEDSASPHQFTHLLRLHGLGNEVLRARTQWRPKEERCYH